MKKELAIRLEEILNLRKKEFREKYHWIFSMCDENGDPIDIFDENGELIEPYDGVFEKRVERQYQTFLTLEGPGRLFNCSESYNAIPLESELEEIRYSDKVKVLLLAVIGKKIVDKLIFEGKDVHVDLLDYSNNGAFDFIRKWKELGALILNYHNHPISVAARPSNLDIINLSVNNTDLDKYFIFANSSISNDRINIIRSKILDELKSKSSELSSFCFDDWGIVTEFDFFSSSQRHNILIDLFEETEKEMHKLMTNG